MRAFVLPVVLGVLMAHTTASAGRTEVVVGGGIVAPRPSDYRNIAEQLGYDERGARFAYELEAGALHAFNYWLSVGPLVRFQYGSLDASYDALPAITHYGVSVAARVEADLFPWPRLFVWCDPSYGRGWIGPADGHIAHDFWGIRGGVGLGSLRENSSLRFRLGYAHAPTSLLTDYAGSFNWGGWLFQLDGVFRVAP